MEDFDKHYAEKMRRAGAPDFSEEDWGALASTLQYRQKQRWRAVPLWWLGTLGVFLLGSNLFWWYMWSHQQKDIEMIRQERAQNPIVERVIQKDTIYRFDTLYRTLIVQEMLPKPPVQTPSAISDTESSRAQAGATAPSAISPELQKTNTSSETSIPEPSYGAVSTDAILPATPGMIPIPAEQYALQGIPATPAARHAKRPFFHPEILVPKKFRIGLFGGLGIPTGTGLSNTSGAGLALNAELAFSPSLALSLDAAYGGFDFKSTAPRSDYGFPPLQSPGNDYAFKYISTEEGLWSYAGLSAGMRYYFKSEKRVSPYLGIGYSLRWLLPTELDGVYVNQATGKDKDFSVEYESNTPSAAYLDAELGLRYRIWKRLYGQSAGKFLYKSGNSQPGMPQYWEFRTGAMWAF